MATTTMERPVPRKKARLSRWDSPWLNPKFLIGLAMVVSMGLLGVVGSQFYDTTLARVASSPLNLPPPWAPGVKVEVEEVAQETTSGGSKSAGALTGTNPFQQQKQEEPTQQTRTDPRGFGIASWEHPLGTESNGRDMLAVLLVGAPRSLRIGLIAAGIGMGVGILLGFTAGFLGGWVDNVIRTISDAVITIPSLAVLIVISAYVRQISVENMGLLLALFAWPGPTRLIRAQVLSMREQGYVKMARLSGTPTFDIMFREMMPNLLPYLAASFTGNVSGAILAATGLEALGLGPTRIPTLGMTIFYAIRAAAILRGMWWWWGIPIAALVVIFSGLFLMTVGLDEIANPRLRGVQSA
jgi:peptide/nickel transport system permease protein